MILRTAMLAICGCAASLAAMQFGGRPTEASAKTPDFVELPLSALPFVENSEVRGLSFARLAVVGTGLEALDPAVLHTFVSDALHDAALGQPGGLTAGSRTIDPLLLKAALPVRLKRASAPFRLERVVLLQSEFRSGDQLRELASGRSGG